MVRFMMSIVTVICLSMLLSVLFADENLQFSQMG